VFLCAVMSRDPLFRHLLGPQTIRITTLVGLFTPGGRSTQSGRLAVSFASTTPPRQFLRLPKHSLSGTHPLTWSLCEPPEDTRISFQICSGSREPNFSPHRCLVFTNTLFFRTRAKLGGRPPPSSVPCSEPSRREVSAPFFFFF